MKLSDYIVNFVEKITDSIFLVSGGGVMHLMDSIGNSNLNKYCCHNEQGCSLAAEGYARIKNSVGVAAVTTGPGGTNAITGVAASWIDGIPILVISGQVRTEVMLNEENKKRGLRQVGPQEINIVDIVKPITKYAVTVMDPNKIKYHLEKAIHLAKEGKPGPVWIDVPLDMQCAEIDESKLEDFVPEPKQKQEIDFNKIVEELNKSERPLLLVGNGIRQANAIEDLWKFVEKTKINVVSAMSGTDLINWDYPYYLGEQGMIGVEIANYAVDKCDLLLIIGTRMQIRQTSWDYDKFAKDAVKIFVDIDSAEMEKINFKPDIPLVGDAKEFLQGLLDKNLDLKRWDVERKKVEYKENPNYIDIYQFLDVLSEKYDYPVFTSNGMAADISHQAFRVKRGQRLITNTAFGEMGKGLPMSIGACAASNKNPVICLEGDGSIMMNLQELETMKYNKLPLKIFLFNNGGYYSIRNTMKTHFGKNFAADSESGVGMPNWENLVKGWGIKYEKIENKEDLSKIDAILNCDDAVFCELVIDPEQKVLPRWMAGQFK